LSTAQLETVPKEGEMNSSKNILQMAAESVPQDVFRYAVENVLNKRSGETEPWPVARHANFDLVVWMRLNAQDGSRNVYALMEGEGMLAKLIVTDVGAEKRGRYDGDEWIVGTSASAVWIWKGPFLPDGVNSRQPMLWEPFLPPGFTYANSSLTRRIVEVVHPALVWWPDKVDLEAEIGSAVPPRPRPHLIRYPGF
jgi:hypothetical protein